MVAYNYYLGPWVWDASDPVEPVWRPPTGTVGCIDLGSVPDLSSPRGSPRKVGFFAVNGLLDSSYDLLAQNCDCRSTPATAGMASAWQSGTGYSPVVSGNLIDMLADHLMHGCDPQGLDACLPLVPTIDRYVEIHLGGHSVVFQKRFVWDGSVHCNRVKALLQSDLMNCRGASLSGLRGLRGKDPNFHRKYLQAVLEKYQITFEDVRPSGWPESETPLPHDTTISDDFNTADSSTVGHLLTWTQVVNSSQNKSNQATITTLNARCVIRAESDLSSSDHYGQCDGAALDLSSSSNQRNICATARFSPSVETMYVMQYVANLGSAGSDDSQLIKTVSGSQTVLGGPTADSESVPYTIKVQCSGSTISGYIAGVSKYSVTDTGIASGTRCGIQMRGDVVSTSAAADNFQAADLAGSGILYTQLERSTRGILRGVYTHF